VSGWELLVVASWLLTIIIGVRKGRPVLGIVMAFLCAPLGLLILASVSNKNQVPATGSVKGSPRADVDLEALRRQIKKRS